MTRSALVQASPLKPTQAWVATRALLAATAALTALLAIGASNPITLSTLPMCAALATLAIDEYNLHRLETRRPPLVRAWSSTLLGSAVLVAALVVFSAT